MNEETLLELIKVSADTIRKELINADSDEVIAIHISRKNGVIHLNNKPALYISRSANEDWKKV